MARVIGIAALISVLAAFFVWVLIEMASFSGSDFRLEKMAIGFAVATVGVVVIYLLTAPLGGGRDRR
jgi:hypothetical protein